MTPEQIEEYLDRHPDDWDFRLCTADAVEEAGDELRAAFLRWSGREKKCPNSESRDGHFYWWDRRFATPPEHSQLPEGMTFTDLYHFWRGREDNWDSEGYYPADTRLDAEKALAVYLREKGMI